MVCKQPLDNLFDDKPSPDCLQTIYGWFANKTGLICKS